MSGLAAEWEQIPEALREPIAGYVRRLRSLCGARLLSVTFYGPLSSSLSADQPRLANVALFESIELEVLRQIAAEGPHFGRQGILAPWVLTPKMLATSRDTFPLELIEIARRHVTLLGNDDFAGLELVPADIRLQCERELRVIEIHLQRGLLFSGGAERQLGRLGLNLAETLVRVLGGLLWLEGQREPLGPYQILSAIERRLGRTLPGILRALDEADTALWSKFVELYGDLRTMIDYVDRLS